MAKPSDFLSDLQRRHAIRFASAPRFASGDAGPSGALVTLSPRELVGVVMAANRWGRTPAALTIQVGAAVAVVTIEGGGGFTGAVGGFTWTPTTWTGGAMLTFGYGLRYFVEVVDTSDGP